jgi:hypothetical protein
MAVSCVLLLTARQLTPACPVWIHHQAAAKEAVSKLEAAESARAQLQQQLDGANTELTAARSQVQELQQLLKREKEQQVGWPGGARAPDLRFEAA